MVPTFTGPRGLLDKYAKFLVLGVKPDSLAEPELGFFAQQTVATPPPSQLQGTSTHQQDEHHLSSPQYTILGKWAGAITKVFSQENLDPEEILAGSIANLLEAAQVSTATCSYALAVFRQLWRSGDKLHNELVVMIEEGTLIPSIADQHPTEGLILGTFYWAMWAASAMLSDYADCFSWFNWLGVDKSEGWRLQSAVLSDLGYSTLLPSDEWRSRLSSLLLASQPLKNAADYQFILTTLETEIERASRRNNSNIN